jgi:hypothetical protein
MSVRTLNDTTENMSCMYDSVSGYAFGPTFREAGEAQEFVDWASGQSDLNDLRSLGDDELRDLVQRWREETGTNPEEPPSGDASGGEAKVD